MSVQLTIASSFSVFALAALALLAPSTVNPAADMQTGAAIEIAAPAV